MAGRCVAIQLRAGGAGTKLLAELVSSNFPCYKKNVMKNSRNQTNLSQIKIGALRRLWGKIFALIVIFLSIIELPSATADVLEASRENLNKTYLRLKPELIENQTTVEKYISIFHCQEYLKVAGNEFALKRELNSFKKTILNEISNFGKEYKIVVTISVDQYNFDKAAFEFHTGTMNIENITLIDHNNPPFNCAEPGSRRVGPSGGLPFLYQLSLETPIIINNIPATESSAEKYIQSLKFPTYRVMYLEITVDLTSATLRAGSAIDPDKAIFAGKPLSIRVYGDSDLTFLICKIK